MNTEQFDIVDFDENVQLRIISLQLAIEARKAHPLTSSPDTTFLRLAKVFEKYIKTGEFN